MKEFHKGSVLEEDGGRGGVKTIVRPEAHIPLPPDVVDDLLLRGRLVRVPVEVPRHEQQLE